MAGKLYCDVYILYILLLYWQCLPVEPVLTISIDLHKLLRGYQPAKNIIATDNKNMQIMTSPCPAAWAVFTNMSHTYGNVYIHNQDNRVEKTEDGYVYVIKNFRIRNSGVYACVSGPNYEYVLFSFLIQTEEQFGARNNFCSTDDPTIVYIIFLIVFVIMLIFITVLLSLYIKQRKRLRALDNDNKNILNMELMETHFKKTRPTCATVNRNIAAATLNWANGVNDTTTELVWDTNDLGQQ